MAEFPALPLFTDAYLADTRHLTTIQHGAYLLMLMTAWRSGGCCLLDDDNYLARITGMDKRTWLANKAILMSFWHLNDDKNGSKPGYLTSAIMLSSYATKMRLLEELVH